MKTMRLLSLVLVAMAWSFPALAQHAGHGGGDPMAGHGHSPEPARAPPTQPSLPTGPRQVQVTITDAGFQPQEIHAGAGDSVTLLITRLTEATCAKEVNFFGRGVQVGLPKGLEVKVTVDVDEPGVVRFGCLGGGDGAVIKVTEGGRR